MYEWLYFAHLSGLAFWLGATVVAAWLAYRAMRTERLEQRVWGLQAAGGITSWIITPSALMVLGAGIAMMVVGQMIGNAKPLWFAVMEQGGGTVAMLCVGVATYFGRKLSRLLAAQADAAGTGRLIRTYMGSMATIAVAVIGVLLTVSLRVA